MKKILLTAILTFASAPVMAAEEAATENQAATAHEYTITLKDHKFDPAELEIPANQKVKVIVKNESDAPIEFESGALQREKVIPAKGKAIISLGPLKKGTFTYEDEFHKDSKGTIVVK